MKVVIFCGGMGTRLREHSDTIPKPLVQIGPRPILWHLMRYYAHFGHTEFVLCLGYKGEMVKQFFLSYESNLSCDFKMIVGQNSKESKSDIEGWSIQFADTGLHSCIGERLRRVENYLGHDDVFLANYSDQLSDLPLNQYLEKFLSSDAIAGFIAVHPAQSFHAVRLGEEDRVLDIESLSKTDIWVNGGYMMLKKSIFNYIEKDEELVEAPFRRLVKEGKLVAYKYSGFWQAMDTMKDKIAFDRMYAQENMPWKLWP